MEEVRAANTARRRRELTSEDAKRNREEGGFSFWYKKTVMPKNKVIAARNLKDCYQVYNSKLESKTIKSKFFIMTILCFPEEQWRTKWIEITDDPKRLLNDSMILNDSSKECF